MGAVLLELCLESLHQCRHIIRQRRVEMDILPGQRVAESERCRMERLAGERVD